MSAYLPALKPAHDLILSQESSFMAVLSDEKINFHKEMNFAMQQLSANDFLLKVAMQNPQSLKDAILNLAAFGLSLNPALKQAYLVPRKGKICLDVGYLGMEYIAIDSGSVLWIQSKIVYSNDSYESMGIDKAPEHRYSAFGKRGSIVGAYCVAKIHDGSFLTEEMNIEEIYKIRSRSESFSKGSMSPWKTDEGEMIKKTVIKRASKGWPKCDRLQSVISFANENEGIDFQRERAPMREKAISPATEEQAEKIRQGLDLIPRTEEQFLGYFSRTFANRVVPSIEELTEEEAGKAISAIQQILDTQAEKQNKPGVF